MDKARLARLYPAIAGRVIWPDAPEYDEARRTFNGLIDRRPAAIVRCTSDADVRATIEAAREDGLALGVRGGGHSVAGTAMVEDGIVADLSPMRGVEIDSARRGRRAGPLASPARPGRVLLRPERGHRDLSDRSGPTLSAVVLRGRGGSR